MRTLLVTLIIAVLFVGCGGGGKATTASAQGTAKLWLAAAVAGDQAKLKELTVDEYEPNVLKKARLLKEDGFSDEHVLWAAIESTDQDLGWTAASGAMMVSLKMREVSAGDWRVVDASLSW